MTFSMHAKIALYVRVILSYVCWCPTHHNYLIKNQQALCKYYAAWLSTGKMCLVKNETKTSDKIHSVGRFI